MFRKLLAACVMFLASSSVVFAGHYYRTDYKNEMVMAPTAVCYAYPIPCGLYIGLSVGGRNVYTSMPVFFKGLEGIVSLGYGIAFNPAFYLGAEIFGGGSINMQNYRNLGQGARMTWNWGVDLIPGLRVTNNVMAYLRLGAARAHFNDQNENNWGWRAGIGAQTNIWEHWDMRAEYVYSRYRGVSGIGNPQSDQWNIGLVWRFM